MNTQPMTDQQWRTLLTAAEAWEWVLRTGKVPVNSRRGSEARKTAIHNVQDAIRAGWRQHESSDRL